MTILEAHELVLADPEPFVRIGAHGASALQIKARAWAKNEDYWTVYFDRGVFVRYEAVFENRVCGFRCYSSIPLPFCYNFSYYTPMQRILKGFFLKFNIKIIFCVANKPF